MDSQQSFSHAWIICLLAVIIFMINVHAYSITPQQLMPVQA